MDLRLPRPPRHGGGAAASSGALNYRGRRPPSTRTQASAPTVSRRPSAEPGRPGPDPVEAHPRREVGTPPRAETEATKLRKRDREIPKRPKREEKETNRPWLCGRLASFSRSDCSTNAYLSDHNHHRVCAGRTVRERAEERTCMF